MQWWSVFSGSNRWNYNISIEYLSVLLTQTQQPMMSGGGKPSAADWIGQTWVMKYLPMVWWRPAQTESCRADPERPEWTMWLAERYSARAALLCQEMNVLNLMANNTQVKNWTGAPPLMWFNSSFLMIRASEKQSLSHKTGTSSCSTRKLPSKTQRSICMRVLTSALLSQSTHFRHLKLSGLPFFPRRKSSSSFVLPTFDVLTLMCGWKLEGQ